jgi:hypothetical protein
MGDPQQQTDGDPGAVDYGLAMPFVACRTQGGPYDDQAFVAGYQVGQIDQSLAVLDRLGLAGAVVGHCVYRPLLGQLDLVAMRHGYQMRSAPVAVGGDDVTWASVEFYRPGRSDPPGSRVSDYGGG